MPHENPTQIYPATAPSKSIHTSPASLTIADSDRAAFPQRINVKQGACCRLLV